MHVSSEEDPIEIIVQGQCTISCIIFSVVQMVNAISWGPMDGLRSHRWASSKLNMR